MNSTRHYLKKSAGKIFMYRSNIEIFLKNILNEFYFFNAIFFYKTIS